ncbi:hypothetical protein GGX14DRAFT_575093 [Mycena pura]|uniref:Uncharacterized protein n=1 Tax=Mycena pura TaxID=153505 RepID=A0AAD6Y163_9AGAR|nr:hypothetical protein GGX14DRAFT_575093 [Mycena pura]
MHLGTLTKIAFLGSALALPAPFPQVIAGAYELAQTVVAPGLAHGLWPHIPTPTVPPFVPSEDNLIVNTTVPQGERAHLGWTFPLMGLSPGTAVHDGSALAVAMFYTAPGDVERRIFRLVTGLCGFATGSSSRAFVDASAIGTYTGRWKVEFGQSTQPDAPVDPRSGCGPEPFNITTMEFVRTWEVVPAA